MISLFFSRFAVVISFLCYCCRRSWFPTLCRCLSSVAVSRNGCTTIIFGTVGFVVSSMSLLFRLFKFFVSLLFRRTRRLLFWPGKGRAILCLQKYVNTFNNMFNRCFTVNQSESRNNSLVYLESRNRHNRFQKHTSKVLYSSGDC